MSQERVNKWGRTVHVHRGNLRYIYFQTTISPLPLSLPLISLSPSLPSQSVLCLNDIHEAVQLITIFMCRDQLSPITISSLSLTSSLAHCTLTELRQQAMNKARGPCDITSIPGLIPHKGFMYYRITFLVSGRVDTIALCWL